MHISARSILVVFLLFSPGIAKALPIDEVAGFGDSITCDSCNDGSYLRLLETAVGVSLTIDDQGVSGNQTGTILTRLQTWIAGSPTADLVILMGGTVDAFQVGYNEATTLNNIQQMVDDLLAASIPFVLMAPPGVLPPCVGSTTPDCATIDTRLGSLAPGIGSIASTAGVPFIDLYQAFADDSNTPALYRSDGLHPLLATGDQLIANLAATYVPEPSTALLMGIGLTGMLIFNRNGNAAL